MPQWLQQPPLPAGPPPTLLHKMQRAGTALQRPRLQSSEGREKLSGQSGKVARGRRRHAAVRWHSTCRKCRRGRHIAAAGKWRQLVAAGGRIAINIRHEAATGVAPAAGPPTAVEQREDAAKSAGTPGRSRGHRHGDRI